MATFSLEDFDAHIENLRSQLRFLSEGLDATDHNTPDWLATDLISLRNKTGRLQDDMQRFRDHLDSQGLASKKDSKKRSRLSLEGTEPSSSKRRDKSLSKTEADAVSPPIEQSSAPVPKSPRPEEFEEGSAIQYIDITAEVQQRLRESRLRRLMESPNKAHKRKFEDSTLASGVDADDDQSSNGERTPTKRQRTTGAMEPVLKRKETGLAGGDTDETNGENLKIKRRKMK